MQDVYIIGVGILRFGKHKNETVRSMAEKVIINALEDAGIDKKTCRQAIFQTRFGACLTGNTPFGDR